MEGSPINDSGDGTARTGGFNDLNLAIVPTDLYAVIGQEGGAIFATDLHTNGALLV